MLEENHLVFTAATAGLARIASEGRRECSMSKRSLAGATPPFRRLHLPMDPKFNEKNAVEMKFSEQS